MENTNTIDLSLVIKSLMEISSSHSTESNTYTIFEGLIKNKFLNINNDRNHVFEFDIGLKKNIKFPFIDFGSITSLHLFGLDELIIFAFYILNKKRYNKVADLGANVGLHSIIMQMCGWKVAPYEPDPIHVEHLNNNFKLNDVTNIFSILFKLISISTTWAPSSKNFFTKDLPNNPHPPVITTTFFKIFSYKFFK